MIEEKTNATTTKRTINISLPNLILALMVPVLLTTAVFGFSDTVRTFTTGGIWVSVTFFILYLTHRNKLAGG